MTSRFFDRKSRFFSICILKNSPSSCNHFDGHKHFCGDQFSVCFSTFLCYRSTFGHDLSIKIIAKKEDFVIQKSEKRRFSTKKNLEVRQNFSNFKLKISPWLELMFVSLIAMIWTHAGHTQQCRLWRLKWNLGSIWNKSVCGSCDLLGFLQWRFGIKLAESSTSASTKSESYSELCRESIII